MYTNIRIYIYFKRFVFCLKQFIIKIIENVCDNNIVKNVVIVL